MVDLEAWERSKPHLQAALDAGGNTHGLDDVFTGLQSGDYQFWHTPDAYCVTEILDFPKKKILNFWLAGGNLKVLMEIIEPVAWAWGRSVGCERSLGQFIYRRGWERSVPDGYQKGWIVFSKDA